MVVEQHLPPCPQVATFYAGPRNKICGKCGGVYLQYCNCSNTRHCSCIVFASPSKPSCPSCKGTEFEDLLVPSAMDEATAARLDTASGEVPVSEVITFCKGCKTGIMRRKATEEELASPHLPLNYGREGGS
jgi:hypothetical protein